MLAYTYGKGTQQSADNSHREAMPGAMSSKANMCAYAAASAMIITTTGVLTSVSLFVLVHLIALVLLIGLVVIIISLLLIGLIRLVRHVSLVGLETKVATRSARGE